MEILSIIQKTIKIRRYNESKSFFEFLNNNIIPYLRRIIRFITMLIMLHIRKRRLCIQFMRNLQGHKHLTIRKMKKGADLTKSIVKSAPKAL